MTMLATAHRNASDGGKRAHNEGLPCLDRQNSAGQGQASDTCLRAHMKYSGSTPHRPFPLCTITDRRAKFLTRGRP